jgi:hypothetical protein
MVASLSIQTARIQKIFPPPKKIVKSSHYSIKIQIKEPETRFVLHGNMSTNFWANSVLFHRRVTAGG